MRAFRLRPARGQALFALASVAFFVTTLAWLDRTGVRSPASLAPGTAPSGAWVCPHGGASELSVALYLANPGGEAVTARITGLGTEAAGSPVSYEVPAGGTLRIDQVPEDRGAASYIEYFDGWIGAGWVSFTDEGVAAEPCAADAARSWYLTDETTQLREEAYVVVANPFAAPAVMDVVLYTADRAPIRHSEWTDLVIPARRSTALHLNTKVEGEPVVAVALEISVGRVVAASLGVSDRSKVRSALGWTQTAIGATFPLMQGSGQTELLLLSTSETSIRFGATGLSEDQPRPVGGLTEQEHGPAAARAYAIPVDPGPVGISLFTLEDAPIVAALRALGPGEDLGATAGAVAGSKSWLVLPASRGAATPGAVLVNDGDVDVVATVELLPQEGDTAAASVTVSVPARSAAAVPPEFWASAPGAAMLIRAEGGPLVALAASTSPGKGSAEAFALSMGVPLPHEP